MTAADREKKEKLLVLITTIGGLTLIIESFIRGWEFWVPPIILIGLVFCWVMSISDKPAYEIRIVIYLVLVMFGLFFRGVHSTGYMDLAIWFAFVMLTYSLLNHIYMMNLLVLEYFTVTFLQLILVTAGFIQAEDGFLLSRSVFHAIFVLFIYYLCVMLIDERLEGERKDRENRKRIEASDMDMEDFLSNISHELRTPVNVVNGMSDLLIKRNIGFEAESIKTAGIRLAYQIEDIQDYTECKRGKVILEEEDYLSTSLINDVVTSFRLNDNSKELELIVDLDARVPTKMRGDIKKLHKMFRHLLENAVKFTKRGGIYVRMFTEKTDYGVNLCIEMTDTGIGMDRKAIHSVSEGMYQVNKKRNRSSGGIGLGLFIVYGFAHRMGGFVKIESERENGTTVRVTVPQKIADGAPCLTLSNSFEGVVLFHVRPDKYEVPRLRDFYRAMAANLAAGIHVPLYPAETVYEVERLKEKLGANYVFMGQEEYEENRGYFDELSKEGIVVVVSAGPDYKLDQGSSVMLMPKPLYAYPVIRILNDGYNAGELEPSENTVKPVFKNVRALIVDDEPMNLVVATSLFREYEMLTDTAGSGKEAIRKFRNGEYDVIFMDHMMPEMDGVEAMKQIRAAATDMDKEILIVALTANAVSGAREMFMKEGFDGFIAKPINTADFERVMLRVLPGFHAGRGGEDR